MSRKALAVVAHAFAVLIVGMGAVAAQAGIGDLTQGLPDLDGDGTDLPGGGNINLPGGGNNGGVTLPGGGGSIDLPGGGGTPTVPNNPITGPSAPPPADDGGGDEDGGGEGSDDANVGGGKGGKGQGHAENDE
jgi:hypothetical protein